MNDLKRKFANERTAIESVVLQVLSSGSWLNGDYSRAFARNFADSLGVSDCILVANGTDALEIALRSIKRVCPSDADEIITVANAGGYTSIACHQVGLVPVYVDVDADTQLMSMSSTIAALGERTAAVVVTHLYGNAVDIATLRTLMASAGYGQVMIVEDCAQSHGASFGRFCVGALGDVATFSFYPTKNLGAFGDAGAVVTSDPQIARHIRAMHQYGWSSKYFVAISGGRNSRIDEIQAAILGCLLPRLADWNTRRRAILERYRAAAATSPLTLINGGPGSVAHLAVGLCEDRAAFRRYMSKGQIATDIHYPVPDCDQVGWSACPMRIGPTGVEVSRWSASRIVTLPCFPEMSDDEVSQVCDALEDWN